MFVMSKEGPVFVFGGSQRFPHSKELTGACCTWKHRPTIQTSQQRLRSVPAFQKTVLPQHNESIPSREYSGTHFVQNPVLNKTKGISHEIKVQEDAMNVLCLQATDIKDINIVCKEENPLFEVSKAKTVGEKGREGR